MTDTTTGDPITLTPAAQQKAKEYLEQDKTHDVFRVKIDYNKKLAIDLDKIRPGDRTYQQGGVNVAIAEALIPILRGLIIDFGPNSEGKVGFQFAGPPHADPDLGNKAQAALDKAAAGGHEAGHSTEGDYMKIFFALFMLTAAELGCTQIPLPKLIFIVVLIALAIFKAALVGMFFMHLKFEGRWKHILLVPPCILAVVLIFALMPDVGRTGAWPHDVPGRLMADSADGK